MTSSNTGPDFCPINLHSLESWDKDLASLASNWSWESFPRSWPLTSPQIIFQDIEFCWLSAASPFLGPKKEKNALERKTLTKLRWHRADCTDEDLKQPKFDRQMLQKHYLSAAPGDHTVAVEVFFALPIGTAPQPLNPRHRAPSLGLPGK